jgi:general secretion pathway protein B
LPAAAIPGNQALPPWLTADQLRQWPPVQLGGSVWSDTPAARFVVLGGQVVREGDSTADGVVVERITPKAVVLRWRELRGALPL